MNRSAHCARHSVTCPKLSGNKGPKRTCSLSRSYPTRNVGSSFWKRFKAMESLSFLAPALKLKTTVCVSGLVLIQTANSGAACAQGRTLLMLIARETTAGGTNMDVSVHRVPVVNVSPLLQSMPKSAAISPDLREVWTAHRVCVREPAVLRPYYWMQCVVLDLLYFLHFIRMHSHETRDTLFL